MQIKHFSGIDDIIFCMDHTGLYNRPIVKWLHNNQSKMWLESGAHIRKSLGLIRGKNDEIDSFRIAMFAYKNQQKMFILRIFACIRQNEYEKINAIQLLNQ